MFDSLHDTSVAQRVPPAALKETNMPAESEVRVACEYRQGRSVKCITSMRFIACLSVIIALIAAANGACAAIWEWGCQGQLGGQQVIFNRYSAVIVDGDRKLGNIRKLFMDRIKVPPELGGVSYEPQDVNVGLIDSIAFTRSDDPKRTLTFTEKSSKKISSRSRLVCGRDESTEITRKVYRYQLENGPARDITMQCIEYQLSTRGGRPGCG
jgi:hypothetical protein